MLSLAHQRCWNHAVREAVARCPECHNHFCRECIVEHDDRVICASCLKKTAQASTAGRVSRRVIGQLLQLTIALLSLWIFFYLFGHALLKIPSSFHEGALWKTPASQQQ